MPASERASAGVRTVHPAPRWSQDRLRLPRAAHTYASSLIAAGVHAWVVCRPGSRQVDRRDHGDLRAPVPRRPPADERSPGGALLRRARVGAPQATPALTRQHEEVRLRWAPAGRAISGMSGRSTCSHSRSCRRGVSWSASSTPCSRAASYFTSLVRTSPAGTGRWTAGPCCSRTRWTSSSRLRTLTAQAARFLEAVLVAGLTFIVAGGTLVAKGASRGAT